MIDDLITRGTTEPYRMFTSRAEYRLLLREDNADLRLTAKGHELGLVDERRWQAFNRKRDAIEAEKQRLSATWIRPETLTGDEAERVLGRALKKEASLLELLRRPELDYAGLMSLPGAGEPVTEPEVAEQVEIQVKYAGYIDRQMQEIDKHRRNEETSIPDTIRYDNVRGLSNEVQQKLSEHRPATVGQASRIAGVTPAAISLLLVHLKRKSA
jgi:tRNA uridine 5-carboxymethylaminomethyl modification enzyme